MNDTDAIKESLKMRIDDFFISANNAVPSNPKTWASVIMNNIARKEIESGVLTNDILNEVLFYAVKKSLQSGVISASMKIIEVDESEANSVDKNSIRRAIAFTRSYVRERNNKCIFPKAPAKWLNLLTSEVLPNMPFSFPPYGLAPVANKICIWYIDGCPVDQFDKVYEKIPEMGENIEKSKVSEVKKVNNETKAKNHENLAGENEDSNAQSQFLNEIQEKDFEKMVFF